MKSRTSTILLSVILLLILGGCAAYLVLNRPAESPTPTTPSTAAPTEAATAPTETEAPIEAETTTPTEAPAIQPAEDPAERLAAYQFAMQQFSFEHTYPDGSPIGFDPANGYIEENSFAIYDVNGDGSDELLITYVTAPMAGMLESVYGYDPDTGTLVPMLQEFPSIGYYTGGRLLAYASHNYGLSVDFWPFCLMTYNPEEGAYTFTASVYAWEQAVSKTGLDGSAYPADVDTEGAGIVYCVSDGDGSQILSQSQYDAWYARQMDGAVLLDIPYQSVSEQNIAAIG